MNWALGGPGCWLGEGGECGFCHRSSWQEAAASWGLAVDEALNQTSEGYRMGTRLSLPFTLTLALLRPVLEVAELAAEVASGFLTI